jgi:sec-independent protein translocase protein TatB
MPSFQDSIFLFVLALLLFGPKRLPVLARELGKWVGEFRKASNEFKMQMEDELRASEQADRQKQIAAMEAAAPIAPALPEPEHPHMPSDRIEAQTQAEIEARTQAEIEAQTQAEIEAVSEEPLALPTPESCHPEPQAKDLLLEPPTEPVAPHPTPLPIATSGEVSIMPPATGLPTPRSAAPNGSALGGLLDAIPEAPAPPAPETALHGN